jgi:signal transduction histidine kinase
MSYSRNEEANLLNRLNQAAVTAALIAGGVSLLLALLLAYQLLKPVNALTQAANSLAMGDLSQRVSVRGNDELAVLAQTFNHMADSLQKAQKSRRELTADIAHELRTPLAVQRANLEALQDGIYLPTQDNLGSILEQNILLTRLVDDLRTLALAESGELPLEKTSIDFVPLVNRIVERFKSQADQNQVGISITHENNLEHSLQLDPMRFEQILNNLLSNALRHTPSGGKIQITTRIVGDSVQLSVHDSGEGIPEEALAHIFERFYRADRSRSRAQGGTGLGLAIALHLAQVHGGDLSASNHPQGGALFTLRLPLLLAD